MTARDFRLWEAQPSRSDLLARARNYADLIEDAAEIARYYRAAQRGTPAAFLQTHHGEVEFVVTVVQFLNLEADRVRLGTSPRYGHSEFFISSGRNCHSPTGQSLLIIPTAAMLAREERLRERERRAHERFEEMMRQPSPPQDHWLRARCLEPECGHTGLMRLPQGTSVGAVMARLYCSRCGGKRVEAWEV
jgi:hypothetical protein